MRAIVLAALSAALGVASCDRAEPPRRGAADDAPASFVQVLHPGGALLHLLSASTGDERSMVKVRVVNGRARAILLDPGRFNTYLLTESGANLFLVKPEQNPFVEAPGGQIIDATLVFDGVVPTGQRATLVINQQTRSGRPTDTPRFEIPLASLPKAGGPVPATTTLSGLRPIAVTRLEQGPAPAKTQPTAVGALKSELGAVETDRGTVVSLPGDVTFDFDEATIRDDARGTLDRLAELIAAGGEGQISIEGHTDAKGDDAYNKRLSEARAEAVKTYLLGRGVDAARLRTIGLGELRPVAPNIDRNGADDEAGRQRNRRVEVILPRTAGPPG